MSFILVETFRKKHGLKTLGMPHMVGHGSHDLNKKKHRFIVMPRYSTDIWSIFLKNDRKMPLHTVYQLAIQMVIELNIIFFFCANRKKNGEKNVKLY